MAASSTNTFVRAWFRLEGATSADFLDISSDNNVAQLRKAIYTELKAKLEPRGVIASELVLATADGKTYEDPRALLSTLPFDNEFIVTGKFACRSPFATAYGPRSSLGGPTWTRCRRSRYVARVRGLARSCWFSWPCCLHVTHVGWPLFRTRGRARCFGYLLSALLGRSSRLCLFALRFARAVLPCSTFGCVLSCCWVMVGPSRCFRCH